MNIFHLTLHSLRIELQINTLKLYGVLFFRGKIPHFFCQMFKIFEFKKAELKDYVENTEADPHFIFCLIRAKMKHVCFFFLFKFQHDLLNKGQMVLR